MTGDADDQAQLPLELPVPEAHPPARETTENSAQRNCFEFLDTPGRTTPYVPTPEDTRARLDQLWEERWSRFEGLRGVVRQEARSRGEDRER